MAVSSEDTLPLNTPVTSKRQISSIGRGKPSWITVKNIILAVAWTLLMAAINFLTYPAPMWVKGMLFGIFAVIGILFFVIPIPGQHQYFLYNYFWSMIKFYFARSANKIDSLGATSEFIPFTYIKGNKLFYKGESTVQVFYRLNGRNIYACAQEIQNGLLNNFHDLLKNLHNSTIKIIGFKCNFKLQDNYDYWKTIIDDNDPENINTSLLPLTVLEWQNVQFVKNFPFYKDTRENLNSTPVPRDMVYLLVISADTEPSADMLASMIAPYLAQLDGNFVEPASSQDIKMYIAKQFGLSSVDLEHGFNTTIDEKGMVIEKFKPSFTNMHSMIFKPKYWKSTDWHKRGSGSKEHYHRILTINSFKSDAVLGWLDPFFEDPAIDCIQMKCQEIPLDKQSKLIGKAINQYTKVEKGAGNVGSFASDKLSQTFSFLADLEKSTDKADLTLVKTTFYIKITGTSLEALNKKEIELKAALHKSLGIEKKNYDALWFKQRDALLSSFGILNDKLSPKIGINLLSSAIALGWPFNNPRVIQYKGFHVGFTDNGMCPICLDLVGQRSLSGMIVGKTGSGKSLLAKLLSMNILLNKRNKIFWFDPENEMANFGHNFNAVHIDLTSQVPVVNKIEFNALYKDYCNNHLTKNSPDDFYYAYMALLNIGKSYKYMYGASEEKIEKMIKFNKQKEYARTIKEIVLVDEQPDYFGLGSFKQHSKLVYITNPQITPQMVDRQVRYFRNNLAKRLNLPVNKVLLIPEVYRFIYNRTVLHSNINPYRIMIKSDEDLKSLNAFKLYNDHKKTLLEWFKQLMPKADVIATTWFNSTLDTLYLKELNIVEYEENGVQITNKSTQDILNIEKFPTIQDHYKLMCEEFEKLQNKKHPKDQQKDIKEKIKIYDQVLSVFDNLVTKNRYDQQGLFYYLWNKDNKLSFDQDKRLIIFNIQNLLMNVRNIKENNYTDGIKFDFQNIFNAQYYLSQQIISSFMINNQLSNKDLDLPRDKQHHLFVFMDEAHASLKQPQFVDWSNDFIKRARKYQAGMWLITQSISDYMRLDTAAELFNSFMFKFYFQSEAQAFADICKKFEVSNVPLTIYEKRWLNPLLGNTTQGRCILTFEDGKRYMMTVTTSVNFIISLLEKDLMNGKPFTKYNEFSQKQDIYGFGINGLLNYLKTDPRNIKASGMQLVLEKAYNTWKDNNLKKYDYNDWLKLEILKKQKDAEIAAVQDAQTAQNISLSKNKALQEKRSNK